MQLTKIELRLKLEKQLQFEQMLTEISTRFINMPAELIDGQIEDALRRICKFLEIDQATLWQWTHKKHTRLLLTHIYNIPEGPEQPEELDGQLAFPWVVDKLLKGETLTHSTEDLPSEADQDKKTYRYFGVKSSIVIPLITGGSEPYGVLGFDALKERTWPDTLVKQIELVAHIFMNALSRKYAEFELLEKEERLKLAIEAGEAALWSLDVDSGLFWGTPRARELYGFSQDEVLAYESVKAKIHPQDRERVDQAAQNTLRSGKNFRIDYRVVLPDENIRWLSVLGKRHPTSTGVPDRLLGVSLDITGRKQMEVELRERLKEIEELKLRLEDENLYLRKELKLEKGFDDIVGDSNAFKSVFFAANQVASTDATVLILGETGTGKGVVANAIHQMSDRKNRLFVTVSCSALPKNLIESELFGREKGAFTGAHTKQAGRFEVAEGGTIFLDEIGEMPLELQSKLLRVLQDGEFERLGSAKTVKVNVRVIAATNCDLKNEVREGRFREDLFYRLNVFPIPIPPLRQRTDDIPLLVQFFVEKYSRKMKKQIDTIPKTIMKRLMAYDWPGNVRELEHMIERSLIITSGPSLELTDNLVSNPHFSSKGGSLMDLETMERDYILKVLQETGWRIEGSSGAASILKLHPSTLRFRIKKLNIHRPE